MPMRIKYELWLHFLESDTMFQVMMTPAGGEGRVPTFTPIAGSLPELAQKLSRAGWQAKGVEDVQKQVRETGVAQMGPVRMTAEQCAVLGLKPQPSQIVWDMDEVETRIEQLESCPPGAIGDQLSQDIDFVANNCKQGGRWTEVCKRGQFALIEYQKRKTNK
jgi:hypothetical protein